MKGPFYISLLSILLIALSINTFAQNKVITGIIIDEESREPLAFVNIVTEDDKYGTSTDIDGLFQMKIPKKTKSLTLSYVGYEKKSVDISYQKSQFIFKMKPLAYLLSEYEVTPGINPTHRIINNVLQYRDTNDPKKLQSFSYTSYDKMVITLDLENKTMSDSVLLLPDSISNISSFIKDKDILLMENVVEKKFMAPERNHEKIIASKVSGLQDPLIVFVVSQIQSTSFYDEIIHMVNNHYINPISKGSLSKYYFQMEDTTYSSQGDTIFSISYSPYSDKNFDGLQGVLSISTKKWAIVNVRAKPLNSDEQGFNIEIQQLYGFVDGHWFPTQLNTNIIFNNTIATTNGEQAKFIGIGKSYHKDVILNPELVKQQFSHIEVELDPNAGYQKEEFWNRYRKDSLSQRDKNTYAFMDSVGKAENFDKTIKQAETLFTGRIPWGKFDIPLDKFAGYNNYEGLWLGAGLRTNKRLSTKWDIGIYGAYAFRAQKAKYGINGQILLYKPFSLKLYAAYSKDYQEAAGVDFYDNHETTFSPERFKNFFISRSNYTDRKEIAFRIRTLRYIHASIGMRVDHKEAAYDYSYQGQEAIIPGYTFDFTEIRLGLRFAFKERYFDNSRMLLSMGTKYPIAWFNYSKGLKGILNGDYDFHRFDLRIKKSFYTKYLGETSVDLIGGLIIGDLPYSNLYRGQGTYGVITVFAPGSFGSMSANEFLSDRYVSAFLSHNFGNLIFQGKKFKPEVVLVTNIGFGWLNHPEQHLNIGFKTMEHGYFESGILINDLVNLYLYNIGIGATYRYGAYSNRLVEDNLSVKISLTFPIKPAFKAVE
ncbi:MULTISPECIES: DUF5686 and carboxypeptidase-like regulatory domain-containing protein [unclassified Lentimicrobium]|uniref:DUF5686 and carboxypeptidase-like regulatory domain-containing protein n=1 Tax=unclassified Lentimicrobium TaxID=2677434 RepID=UPI001554CE02|nr:MULTISPECIES: DUF5686 and carboxypeptidase-like regulatory domain-containing protein [unclassified Lentimicrobium]NPD46880.1 carboxypeptidase-like regulatory domain-containing protein [Lentimicrobium sp. S6]NPD83838.1 carboxypeptidase-like regulatory domain-containing protein [Lentimicrobium sp. L6]